MMSERNGVPSWAFAGAMTMLALLMGGAWLDIRSRLSAIEQNQQATQRQLGVLEGRTAWLDSERRQR